MLTFRRSIDVLIAVSIVTNTSALALINTPRVDSQAFESLRETPLVRASDGQVLDLPSLWRSNGPFGIGDEVAVVTFLRHFGWFLCWEHAAQLRDVALPALKKKSGKLFLIGIGSDEAALEFASQLEVDPSICFGDNGGTAGDALGLEKGFGTMWNPQAVNAMMSRNNQDSLTALGEAYKSAADNIGIKKLAPTDIADTLRQGGTFVFRGNEPILQHFDSKVGDNCDIDAILASICAK